MKRMIEWRLTKTSFVALLLCLLCLERPISSAWARSQDAGNGLSSTVLQMHRIYRANPPHDSRLYDILQVSPNATVAQISKNYRRLSRQFHPDKTSHHDSSDRESEQKLRQVQHAYNILKEDATRLIYHQYGLTNPNLAVVILLGPQYHHHSHLLDQAHHDLLQLMGYETLTLGTNTNWQTLYNDQSSSVYNNNNNRDFRIRLIAAVLVERLRPLVEATVPPHIVAQQLVQECDRWKVLPLGGQVIRCIGRAYRHAGQDYLQQKRQAIGRDPMVPIRRQWRQGKALFSAAFATGKATITEQVWTQQEKRRKQLEKKLKDKTKRLDYHSELGDLPFEKNEEDDGDDDEETMYLSDNDEEHGRHEEKLKNDEISKAKETLLTSLQVDALWKVSKIDLDKTIQKACKLILYGDYSFYPSHQTSFSAQKTSSHGWVTSQGRALQADEASRRTAEALIFLGNIMVERSKVETSWK